MEYSNSDIIYLGSDILKIGSFSPVRLLTSNFSNKKISLSVVFKSFYFIL